MDGKVRDGLNQREAGEGRLINNNNGGERAIKLQYKILV